MARKALTEKESRNRLTTARYEHARRWMKQQISRTPSYGCRVRLHHLLQEFPRSSAKARLHNRCFLSGRPKSYYRQFGLSRIALREMAYKGVLPGVTKASW